MDTQTSNTPHAAPTPWWKGLIVLFVMCCLLFAVMSLMSDKNNTPQPYKPRPRELTKEERREEREKERKEKLQMAVENLHLRLEPYQAEETYDVRGGLPSTSDCDNYFHRSLVAYVNNRHGYNGICAPTSNSDATAQYARNTSEGTQSLLPPVNLSTETINPLMREKLRLHEDLVRNLLQ